MFYSLANAYLTLQLDLHTSNLIVQLLLYFRSSSTCLSPILAFSTCNASRCFSIFHLSLSYICFISYSLCMCVIALFVTSISPSKLGYQLTLRTIVGSSPCIFYLLLLLPLFYTCLLSPCCFLLLPCNSLLYIPILWIVAPVRGDICSVQISHFSTHIHIPTRGVAVWPTFFQYPCVTCPAMTSKNYVPFFCVGSPSLSPLNLAQMCDLLGMSMLRQAPLPPLSSLFYQLWSPVFLCQTLWDTRLLSGTSLWLQTPYFAHIFLGCFISGP